MIDAQEQQEIFLAIAKRIKKKIETYAIGGTALIFHGLKQQTLDVDLVFSSAEDRNIFIEAAKSLGYKDMDAKIVYDGKTNKPIMIKLSTSRLDLFINDVITSRFSEKMKMRAEKIRQFDNNLFIKVANIHDILIMKCVTDREKDIIDILSIIKDSEVNWDLITSEAENQIRLGNERAVIDIGRTLEMLKNKRDASIPQSVLDDLWGLLNKQVDEKSNKDGEK